MLTQKQISIIKNFARPFYHKSDNEAMKIVSICNIHYSVGKISDKQNFVLKNYALKNNINL